MGLVSVRDSAHLKATVLALKAAPKQIRGDVRRETRAVAAPQWTAEMHRLSHSDQQTRMLANTARITVSDQSVRVRAAGSKRKALSGGAKPYDEGKGFEFGSTRTTGKQMPKPRRRGYVFYPAIATMAPRIIALWVQTAVRVIHNALEGKR